MLYKSKAICLHSIPYSDTSIIVHLFTEKHGKQVFMVRGVRRKKAQIRTNAFFPLNLLEIEAYYKTTANFQKLKEVNLIPYLTIYNVPVKTSIAFFLAELLYRTLQTEQSNSELFEFLFKSFKYFDSSQKVANFHLIFIVQFLKYEGFALDNNYSEMNNCFSLRNGKFCNVNSIQEHEDIVPPLSIKFAEIIQCNYENMHNLNLNNTERSALLNKLIDYLYLHMPGISRLKSLSVLQEIFKI